MSNSVVSSIPDSITVPSIDTVEGDYGTPQSGRNKISRCLMTMFVPNTEPKWLHPSTYFNTDRVQIWVAQFERGDNTGTLHVQAYVEFINADRYRWSEIRTAIDRATGKTGDIRVPKKCSNRQRSCAVNYCLKEETRVEDTGSYIWDGNKIQVSFDADLFAKRGKKRKSDEREDQVRHILSKPIWWTWDQILHEDLDSQLLLAACSWGPKFHAGRHASNERRTIDNVIIFYGAGGTGKTTLAQNFNIVEGESLFERYYKRNADDGKFWGGGRTAYRGQRIIHLEEFCGQETAANFKEICDVGKHGPSVNVKNSGTELNHDTVIITSNHHPAAWYRNLCADAKQWTPLCRRFTQVWFFPELRPDGSRNIPDAEHPPYYVDQTEEFKNPQFIQDYDMAKDHASQHWPLPAEPIGPPTAADFTDLRQYV